jgi:hypothetical protein
MQRPLETGKVKEVVLLLEIREEYGLANIFLFSPVRPISDF